MHLPDLARWAAERGLPAPVVECARIATLEGYALTWDYRSPTRRGGAANVRPTPGTSTPGVALRIDAPTLAALDQKEGHPDRYRRGPEPKPLRLPGGARLDAWVYEVTPDWRCASPAPPRSDYLNLLIEAGQRFGLPAWHLRALAETPTVDP